MPSAATKAARKRAKARRSKPASSATTDTTTYRPKQRGPSALEEEETRTEFFAADNIKKNTLTLDAVKV